MPAAEKSQPELVNHFLSVNGFNPTILEKSPTRASWSDLLNDRTAGRRTMRAILAKCQTEGRDLTAVERGAYDLLSTAVGNLTDEIDTRSASGNREGRRHFGGGTHAGPADAPPIKGMLRRDQRMADTLQNYGSEEIGLGNLVRASITGNWDGLEDFRSQSGNNGPNGGFLVPDYLSARVIDMARNASRVVQAGALTIPIAGPTTFATVEQDPVGHWRAENQDIEESEMVFGGRTFVPKTLAALVRCSIELLEDAPNLSALVESSIAAELGTQLDKMCLVGDGIGKPLGLLNTPGINLVTMPSGVGEITSFHPLSYAVQLIRSRNAEPGAFLLSSRTAGDFDRLRDENLNPLVPPTSVKERQLLVTNQIPNDLVPTGYPGTTDATAIFTGQWEDFYIAMRTNLVIEATRVADTAFKKMQVLIRGYLRADAFAVRPNHFAAITGITPQTGFE